MIDNNETEIAAMELFKKGQHKEASEMQDSFLAGVKSACKDHCSCPASCKFHGKCIECITIHRGHGDHLPHCLQDMVNKRLEALSALTEHPMR